MKKSTHRRYLRLTCTFLAFLLIVLSMPLNIIAVVEEAEQNITEITEDTTGKVVEVTERREENVKHFQKPDGTYTAVSYANEVHRKDEDGNWQDIDNSLSITRSASAYSTKDGRVSFSKSFEAGKELFSISEDGDTVAFSLMQKSLDTSTSLNADDGAKYVKVTASGITNPPLRAASWDTVEQAAEVDTSSRIIYESVNIGTDIEYILDGNDVKENIIIKQAQNDYAYDFRMTLVGLSASLCADGSVSIYDPTSKEIKYTVPAPYMYDSNGNTSYDVSYELEQVKEGIYILRVSASKEWINADGRAFPVVIDPTMIKNDLFFDTYTDTNPSENYPHGYSGILIVGSTQTAFIRRSLPALPEGGQPNRIQLKLSYYFDSACAGQYIDLSLWRVDNSWEEESLTASDNIGLTQYTDCTKRVDGTDNISASINYSDFFDITSIAKDWYAGVNNYGVALKRAGGSISQIRLKSFETSQASHGPHLYVDYLNPLSDGVYSIRNIKMPQSYMDTRDDSYEESAFMQKTVFSETNPIQVFDKGALFKISKSEDSDTYIIRLMTNNLLTFDIDNSGNVITKKISASDSNVLERDTFVLTYNSLYGGYTIQKYASPRIIATKESTAQGDDGGEGAKLTYQTVSQLTAHGVWQLTQYEGAHVDSCEMIPDGEVIVGNTVTFTTGPVSSTRPGYNSVYASYGITNTYIGTLVATDYTTTFTYTLHEEGEMYFDLYINKDLGDSVSLSSFINVKLPLPEGVYFFKNKGTNKCIQLDNDISNSNSTTEVELFELDAGNDQRWNIVYQYGGYYTISSNENGNYLTAPAQVDDSVTQTPYTWADNQLWKVTKVSEDAYKFSPKSSPTLYLAAGDDRQADLNVEIRADRTDARDEWTPSLPLSGSELTYDPALWNQNVGANNCYNYAIDCYCGGDLFYPENPGSFSEGYNYDLDNPTAQQIISFVESDFERMSITQSRELIFMPIGRYDVCPFGTYKVALVMRLDNSYHWYRQDSDGLWSHKMSAHPITRLDGGGYTGEDDVIAELIMDPMTCNRNEYTNFVGYFAVTPWEICVIEED